MTSLVPGLTAGSTTGSTSGVMTGSTTVMGISAGQVGRGVGAEPEGEKNKYSLVFTKYS